MFGALKKLLGLDQPQPYQSQNQQGADAVYNGAMGGSPIDPSVLGQPADNTAQPAGPVNTQPDPGVRVAPPVTMRPGAAYSGVQQASGLDDNLQGGVASGFRVQNQGFDQAGNNAWQPSVGEGYVDSALQGGNRSGLQDILKRRRY